MLFKTQNIFISTPFNHFLGSPVPSVLFGFSRLSVTLTLSMVGICRPLRLFWSIYNFVSLFLVFNIYCYGFGKMKDCFVQRLRLQRMFVRYLRQSNSIVVKYKCFFFTQISPLWQIDNFWRGNLIETVVFLNLLPLVLPHKSSSSSQALTSLKLLQRLWSKTDQGQILAR